MNLKNIVFTISILGFSTNYLSSNNESLKGWKSCIKEIFCTTIEGNPWGISISETRRLILEKYNLKNPTKPSKIRSDFGTSHVVCESCIIAGLISMWTANSTATCAQLLPYVCVCLTVATNANLNTALEPVIKDMEENLKITPPFCSSLQSRMKDIKDECNKAGGYFPKSNKME